MVRPIKNFPFEETPVQYSASLSEMMGISLYIKRDDLFPEAGGGNKARKSQFIMESVKTAGHDAVVTCGDINSNHNRATALMAAKLGLKAVLVVHNGSQTEEWRSPNIMISRMTGAEIVYCSRPDVAQTMENAMNALKLSGYNPYYIWGGGHCVEGSYAFYDAVTSITEQFFDYVVVASGTGTTHAGLHVGFRKRFPDCRVVGISISREAGKGVREVLKSVSELEGYLNFNRYSGESDIMFNDDYLLGGYGCYSYQEIDLITKVAMTGGILLDPVYTGKAFYGMVDLIEKGEIPRHSTVLFWHTGGQNNLIGYHIGNTK